MDQVVFLITRLIKKEKAMKNKLLVSLLICLAMVSVSSAQYSKIIRANNQLTPDRAKAVALANQYLAAANAAGSDTVVIADGTTAGIIEATINGDTTAGTGRTDPMRVYVLIEGQIYTQNAAIQVVDPTGVLTIIGRPAAGVAPSTKPVITLTGVNGVDPGMNTIEGSLKLDNIHQQNIFTNDAGSNNNMWVGQTANSLPQFVDCNNCFFEFIQLDSFSMDGYTNGAKFRFTNCYFRNLFNVNQWWGGRVFYCKHQIDTVWVENCTVTGGGLIFLGQGSLTKFAYYNHNTIVNANKYWQLGVYYLEGYWVNNIFINQNWVGEDYYNVATGGQDPDPGMLMGTFGLDTLTQIGGITKPIPLHIQPELLNADSSVNASLCGLDKIKALVADNVLWQDTIMLKAYYKNELDNGNGPYGTAFVDTAPSSWLTWTSPASPPYQVVNVPGIWMNPRTTALFNGSHHLIVQKDNWVDQKVNTVTPGIADYATADQMAKWDAQQWGVPGFTSSTQDILHSKYIFGDFDATTIPGNKTEDGSGITKFTDLNESFAQTGTPILSTIDGLPVGALIWDDAKLAAYDSKAEWGKVLAYYAATGVAQSKSSAVPQNYELAQNYPNPFNPTTQINFTVPSNKGELVTLKVYNVLGQEVATLFSGTKSAGSYQVPFDGSKLASGVYLYRLQAGNMSITKKMVMMK
jgi:Secretion system C-terminal sorting domain